MMNDVFEAFRNCISDGKCDNWDCPYENKCRIANGIDQNIHIPKHLALDVLNKLKENDATIADMKKKLQEEKDYRQYLQDRKIKGQLAGYLVMSPEQVIEHNVTESLNRQTIQLKKLSNNPALDYSIRCLIHQQINNIFSLLFWRSLCMRNAREKAKHEK